MTYTNTGLVKHAEAALRLPTKYMWGGILRPVEQLYDMLFKTYGNKAGTGYTTARWNELRQLFNTGTYGCDCVGLIKSYYWSGKAEGGTGSPKYDGNTDINATAMFNRAAKKGAIKDLPETPGLIVYSRTHPHVGIYIGKGYTIESTLGSRGDGVVKRRLDNLWTDWFECPFIRYENPKPATALKTVILAYNAKVRRAAKYKSECMETLTAGTKVVIVAGTETKDPASGYTYVKLYGKNGWIITTSIK